MLQRYFDVVSAQGTAVSMLDEENTSGCRTSARGELVSKLRHIQRQQHAGDLLPRDMRDADTGAVHVTALSNSNDHSKPLALEPHRLKTASMSPSHLSPENSAPAH